MFYSRDVIFNEQKYGFDESAEPEESEQQVYLEYPDEPSETVDLPAPPSPRRSERERRQPNYYGFQCTLSDVKEPKSVSDAQESQEWTDAMQAEIDSLHDHDVWELVELPEGHKPVGSKWVFKLKTNTGGSVERCKARLVTQGYSQKEGLDYDEILAKLSDQSQFT